MTKVESRETVTIGVVRIADDGVVTIPREQEVEVPAAGLEGVDGAGRTAEEEALARGVGSAPDPVNRAMALDVINRFTIWWAA